MKFSSCFSPFRGWLSPGLCLPVVALLCGCGTTDPRATAAQPGTGLREYRQMVADLTGVLVAARESVEGVGKASDASASGAYVRFEEALQRLEVVSVRARARADAMEQRGMAYFEEWAEEITGTADEVARRTAREHFESLRQNFDAVMTDSQRARQAFRAFLEGMRAQHAALGWKPAAAAIEQARPALDKVAREGRSAEEALGRLVTTLNEAESAVMSASGRTPQGGGS